MLRTARPLRPQGARSRSGVGNQMGSGAVTLTSGMTRPPANNAISFDARKSLWASHGPRIFNPNLFPKGTYEKISCRTSELLTPYGYHHLGQDHSCEISSGTYDCRPERQDHGRAERER